jgi:hypothetical protein
MLGAVNDASGAALRSLPRLLTAAARDHLSVRKAGPENRQRPAEQINGRDGSAARFALFAASNNIDIATRVLWWDQPWQKERRFLFVLTCKAAAAGPVTSGQGRKPRSGGAERASLEGMAPFRPHGDKQVGTLTALGDSQPVAEALRRIGELYAIEASVRGRSSSTYRRAERGKLGPSSGQCFNRPVLAPAWLQLFAHLLARACKSRCRQPRTSAARASALISKYRDHTPALSTVVNLAHHGVDLSRSTLAGWVGEAC